MEKLFGPCVSGDLVKVKSGWADNKAGLRAYGYGNRSYMITAIPHSEYGLPRTEENEIVLKNSISRR